MYAGDDFFYNPLVARQEETCDRTDQKRADDGADAEWSAEQKTQNDERCVRTDADERELPVGFVAQYDGNKVVWPGSGIAFYDDCHTVRKDDASCRQHGNLEPKSGKCFKQRFQQYREKVDDGTAACHADDGANFKIWFIHKKKNDDDQETDDDMNASVSEPADVHEALFSSEKTLNQNIVRVWTHVGEKE